MILHDPSIAGPHDPVPAAPRRAAGSIRRTSTIDTNRPEGILGPPIIEARARDLGTASDGTATVLATAGVRARLDGPAHGLVAITSDPESPALEQLIGARVGPGFRSRVDRAVPELVDTGALLYLLLDDLPGATLVSGYSMVHADVPARPRSEFLELVDARADVCAGWARDSAKFVLMREHGRSPTPIGPPASPFTRTDDPLAFHPTSDLDPMGMRRLRRVDVRRPDVSGEPFAGDVFFRDTHVDVEGNETIVHEYTVAVEIDGATRTISAIEATPDVLPWQECPAAIESAQRVVGRPLAGLRPLVRREFVGVGTCTHLNDVLRGLADLDHLIDVLDTGR